MGADTGRVRGGEGRGGVEDLSETEMSGAWALIDGFLSISPGRYATVCNSSKWRYSRYLNVVGSAMELRECLCQLQGHFESSAEKPRVHAELAYASARIRLLPVLLPWRNSPQWARASLLPRLCGHTQTRHIR
jgi:hypothetical protein